MALWCGAAQAHGAATAPACRPGRRRPTGHAATALGPARGLATPPAQLSAATPPLLPARPRPLQLRAVAAQGAPTAARGAEEPPEPPGPSAAAMAATPQRRGGGREGGAAGQHRTWRSRSPPSRPSQHAGAVCCGPVGFNADRSVPMAPRDFDGWLGALLARQTWQLRRMRSAAKRVEQSLGYWYLSKMEWFSLSPQHV